MTKTPKEQTPETTMDHVLRRMLNTPPKHHEPAGNAAEKKMKRSEKKPD